MSQLIKKAIVVGASGTIGAPIVKALLESGKFGISVLSRPESTNTYPAGTKVFKSDYSETSLIEAFKGHDAVICVLGAAGFAEEPKLVDAAAKAGVKRFIPSEFSSNSLNSKTSEHLPIFSIKPRVVAQLKALELKGMSWTAIQTGLTFDAGVQFGLHGFNINTKEAVIFEDGNIQFSTTNMSQMGNAVLAVLLKPEETANQYLFVHSFTATQNEILSEFEKTTGEKWKVSETTVAATEKEGQELLARGDPAGTLLLLKVINFGSGFGSDFTKDHEVSNGKLGLPTQDLTMTVAAVVTGMPI